MRLLVFWVGVIFMLPFVAVGFITTIIGGAFFAGVELAQRMAKWVKKP